MLVNSLTLRPAPRPISSSAASRGRLLRYGRSDVIASNASATVTTRATSGDASPLRRLVVHFTNRKNAPSVFSTRTGTRPATRYVPSLLFVFAKRDVINPDSAWSLNDEAEVDIV